MNIFIIPSWYPSDINPAWGIFCKEQAVALAEIFPNDNFCISLWGHNYANTFLQAKDHFKNIKKILQFLKMQENQQELRKNLVEYNTPTLTWTKRIVQGNINNIIKANKNNFRLFSQRFGKPDVIHAHVGYPAGYIAMHLSKKFSVPYIITEHMTPFPFDAIRNKSGQLIPKLTNSYKLASSIIAVSEALKITMEKISFKNVIYIPNMVNELIFKPQYINKKNDSFHFLFVGGLIERKGLDVLFEVISLVGNKINIQLTIGGEGALEHKYKNLSKTLGINHLINWKGLLNREQVIKEIQKCNALILTSRQENLPMVLLEAIACGKPIIATRCGGPEVIVNENNGVLVDVDDVHRLAKAMKQMVEQYDKYNSAIIRKDFEERFSRPVVANQIMNVYKSAIAEFHQVN